LRRTPAFLILSAFFAPGSYAIPAPLPALAAASFPLFPPSFLLVTMQVLSAASLTDGAPRPASHSQQAGHKDGS